jgi:hypothetical protein
MQQRMRLTTYEEHATNTAHELERVRHENAVLRSGALPPLKLDHKLQVTYHRHSEGEHVWNYTRQLLDITREEVDVRTHGIIHLDHALSPLCSLSPLPSPLLTAPLPTTTPH